VRRSDAERTPLPGPVARVPRFSLGERLSHWVYALLFIAAFVSGLLMWLPPTREWMAGARHTDSQYHGVVGLVMVGLPLVLSLVADRRRFLAGLREVDLWDGDDRRWFWAALRGGTLRGAAMPPQGRLNAGQKLNVVLVAAMAVGFVVTGVMLSLKADLPAWLVSRALWLHGFLAIAGVTLLLGHLAHVFLTKHGRDYLSAMIHGGLPMETALARHSKWVAVAGTLPDGSQHGPPHGSPDASSPAAVPAPAPDESSEPPAARM